jgi:hypothetical protein
MWSVGMVVYELMKFLCEKEKKDVALQNGKISNYYVDLINPYVAKNLNESLPESAYNGSLGLFRLLVN